MTKFQRTLKSMSKWDDMGTAPCKKQGFSQGLFNEQDTETIRAWPQKRLTVYPHHCHIYVTEPQ